MKISFYLLLCVFSQLTFGQDERYFRSLFGGKKTLEQQNNLFEYKVKVESAKYEIDLNRDGKVDSIQSVKKDGVDFIRVNDDKGRLIFEEMLETKGKNSSIFKVSWRKIRKNVDVLLIHFYEGEVDSAIYESGARLYILTIRNKNLKKISMTKGPQFFIEQKKIPHKYFARRYSVNTIDYNKDGTREISISFNRIHEIYFYREPGIWKSF